MSAEWLELEERRREEESRLRGIEPKPRFSFYDMALEVIRGYNEHDPNVVATIPPGGAEVPRRLPDQPS
jgi:hypothetical protein